MPRKKVIKSPTHVRQILSDEINKLREGTASKEELDQARAVGYLSNVALSAIKDGELENRIREVEKQLCKPAFYFSQYYPYIIKFPRIPV